MDGFGTLRSMEGKGAGREGGRKGKGTDGKVGEGRRGKAGGRVLAGTVLLYRLTPLTCPAIAGEILFPVASVCLFVSQIIRENA